MQFTLLLHKITFSGILGAQFYFQCTAIGFAWCCLPVRETISMTVWDRQALAITSYTGIDVLVLLLASRKNTLYWNCLTELLHTSLICLLVAFRSLSYIHPVRSKHRETLIRLTTSFWVVFANRLGFSRKLDLGGFSHLLVQYIIGHVHDSAQKAARFRLSWFVTCYRAYS